jgi:hypothetical protein
VWLLTVARPKVRLQSTQVKLEPEHWRKWLAILGCGGSGNSA